MSAIVVALIAGGMVGYFLGAAKRVKGGETWVTRGPDYLVVADQFGNPVTVGPPTRGSIVVEPDSEITIGAIFAVWTQRNGAEARAEMAMEGSALPLTMNKGDKVTFQIPATLPQLSEPIP